jgi:ABC-2 type transport system ATP-binding protein
VGLGRYGKVVAMQTTDMTMMEAGTLAALDFVPSEPMPVISTDGANAPGSITGSAIIEVRDLRKTYTSKKGGTKKAVDGLDLTIFQGECFAILGPNGAGKSTTVEILEGFRKRDAGSVIVLGEDPNKPSRNWKARIGVVLQDTGDMGDLTVAEVVNATASYYPNPRNADEVITAVGLEEKRNAKLSSLSGGQRRRVDVALGIIGNPELLFLDEPTTGFDPEVRREFWELIRNLKAGGTTVVLTTHYMDEAAYLADRIGVVINGRIAALDTAENLTGNHASLEDAYLELISQNK